MLENLLKGANINVKVPDNAIVKIGIENKSLLIFATLAFTALAVLASKN